MSRPTWDDVYMQIAEIVAQRSTCLRRKVGAVLVKDNHLIATGYNGAPAGLSHCETRGCFREENNIPSGERYEACYSVHAEQNCIIQAAIHGSGTKGAEMYITYAPCNICAKMLVNAGILKTTFKGEFPDPMAEEILRQGRVVVEKYEEEKVKTCESCGKTLPFAPYSCERWGTNYYYCINNNYQNWIPKEVQG